MRNSLTVAITGQSGSGKSSLSKIYANMGYTVIDCDKIAADIHLNTECIEQLIKCFGKDILASKKERAIDKKKLSEIAFSTLENLKKLTEITHPFIIKEILRIIKEAFGKGEQIVFVDGAVIIGYEFERYCDKIILIVSSKENQYKRLMARDNITSVQAENRILKQMSIEKMTDKADFIVYNNLTQDSLSAQAEDIIDQIIKD